MCLFFGAIPMSLATNAQLVGIEYFVEKNLARKHMQLDQWNKLYDATENRES